MSGYQSGQEGIGDTYSVIGYADPLTTLPGTPEDLTIILGEGPIEPGIRITWAEPLTLEFDGVTSAAEAFRLARYRTRPFPNWRNVERRTFFHPALGLPYDPTFFRVVTGRPLKKRDFQNWLGQFMHPAAKVTGMMNDRLYYAASGEGEATHWIRLGVIESGEA